MELPTIRTTGIALTAVGVVLVVGVFVAGATVPVAMAARGFLAVQGVVAAGVGPLALGVVMAGTPDPERLVAEVRVRGAVSAWLLGTAGLLLHSLHPGEAYVPISASAVVYALLLVLALVCQVVAGTIAMKWDAALREARS